MIFLLDTNAVSALAAERPRFMERRLGFSPRDFGISSIVAFEILFGINRAGHLKVDLRKFDDMELEVVPFDVDDAHAAGAIRAELQRLGTPIGPYDVLIAGQALARGLIVITRNVREFQRVKGLRLENWED